MTKRLLKLMIYSGDTLIGYDQVSGSITLNRGTSSTTLGAQTLPVNSAEFSSVTGSTVLAILKALESLVLTGQTTSTQATTAVDNRFSSCSGVTGFRFRKLWRPFF